MLRIRCTFSSQHRGQNPHRLLQMIRILLIETDRVIIQNPKSRCNFFCPVREIPNMLHFRQYPFRKTALYKAGPEFYSLSQ